MRRFILISIIASLAAFPLQAQQCPTDQQPATSQAQQFRPTVAILGDSYSTFEGYSLAGNAIWYFTTPNPERNDVCHVTDTWWWKVVKDGGYKLGVNDAYSGSTISYSGYNGQSYSDRRSFLNRVGELGNPDIVLVCGGTNDSWAGAPVGEYKYEGITPEDYYFYRPALARLLGQLQEHYPNAAIWFILNDSLRDDIDESTLTVCAHYGIPCVCLENIDKQNGHPSVKGMADFASQVLAAIK